MKNDKKRGLMHVVKKTVKGNVFLSMGLALAITGTIVLALIPPLLLEKMVDGLAKHQVIAIKQALFYFFIFSLAGLFDAGKEVLITVFGQKITHGLRSEMCRKLNYLPASYFTSSDAGTTTSRFVNDVDTIEALFTNGIISMCVDICKVCSVITVIFVKSIGLGLLLVVTAPILFVFTRSIQKRTLAAQKDNRKAIGRVNHFIPETIMNIRTIHCLKKEAYMEKKYDESIQRSYRAMERSNLYDSIYSPIIVIISTILIAVLMILSARGGQMQEFFGMTVGTAVAVISYVSKVFTPIEDIGMEIQNIQSAVAGVTRINELLSEKEIQKTDPLISTQTLLAHKKEGICFDNVCFSYEENQTVLENLTFFIQTGEIVTLAGRTGAGKSTIFKLLLGMYTPTAGMVQIFGQDAYKIPNEEKRQLFGYVEQSFHCVPGSVADQISLYDEKISREEVIKAATLVGLHESILQMPNGYDTDCSQAVFSQGQMQLLSIARAVVSDPPVMLLDEITANLDTLTEQKVFDALKRAVDGRTVISISHRLYTNMGSRLITI